MVTTTLHYDGTPVPSNYSHVEFLPSPLNAISFQRMFQQQTLMDEFEYVCHGRVFKVKDAADGKLQVH